MKTTEARQKLAMDAEQLARVEELLMRYPDVTAEEQSEIADLLQKWPIMDQSLLSTNLTHGRELNSSGPTIAGNSPTGQGTTCSLQPSSWRFWSPSFCSGMPMPERRAMDLTRRRRRGGR